MSPPATFDKAKAKLDAGQLLSAAEVGVLFSVHAKTVSRWDTAGVLPAIRTPGNHRRWAADTVAELLKGWQR